ncbi:hypothetical protein KDL44_01510 [bacterium]|nr:hypothetical protein [bacterium]
MHRNILSLVCAYLLLLSISAAHAEDFAGASGMAWIADNHYLCVQDLKADRPGSRIGILTVDTENGGYDYLPLEPDWQGELPHDLESVYGFRTRPGEFLLCESGAYENWTTHEYHIGRIFHVKLEQAQDGWRFSLLGTIPLPEHIHEIEGLFVMSAEHPEAIVAASGNSEEVSAYLHRLESYGLYNDPYQPAFSEEETAAAELVEPVERMPVNIILGSRGGDLAYQPAKLYYCIADLASHEMITDGGSGVELSVPPANNPWERGISDLYMDDSGVLWIAKCSDRGDNGPFDSVIYRMGYFEPGESYFSSYGNLEWKLSGVKVEAICRSVLPGSTLCYATDDEGFGGIWRSLGPATDSRF